MWWCFVATLVNRVIANVSMWAPEWPNWWRRLHAVQKLRTDPRRVATPAWVVTELLYHLTDQQPDWADAIFVVTIVGGLLNGKLAEVASPGGGRSLVRLQYDWEIEIVPWLHLPPRALSSTRLAELAGFGGLLRARMRAAARSAR
jgi:hypothetical protein